MNMLDKLENFGPPSGIQNSSQRQDEPVPPEESLEVFEEGYRSGWDDAVQAKSDSADHISEGLAQNLLDLSFTFHEAQAATMKSVAPLLDQIVKALLPEVLPASLATHILEELQHRIRVDDVGTVLICVSPDNTERVSSLISSTPAMAVTVQGDSGLSDIEAVLRLDREERHLDLADLATGIQDAIDGLIFDAGKEVAYG
jgi:flagellar assembly protein FliH